jgi:hypothetical protein
MTAGLAETGGTVAFKASTFRQSPVPPVPIGTADWSGGLAPAAQARAHIFRPPFAGRLSPVRAASSEVLRTTRP